MRTLAAIPIGQLIGHRHQESGIVVGGVARIRLLRPAPRATL